jgi:hypothetical protein
VRQFGVRLSLVLPPKASASVTAAYRPAVSRGRYHNNPEDCTAPPSVSCHYNLHATVTPPVGRGAGGAGSLCVTVTGLTHFYISPENIEHGGTGGSQSFPLSCDSYEDQLGGGVALFNLVNFKVNDSRK